LGNPFEHGEDAYVFWVVGYGREVGVFGYHVEGGAVEGGDDGLAEELFESGGDVGVELLVHGFGKGLGF